MEKVSEIKISYSAKSDNLKNPIVASSSDAFNVLYPHFNSDTIELKEQFIIAYLSRNNKIKGVYNGFTGGITSTIVDIRIVLAIALKTASTGIIMAHNHPSGNLVASEADKLITEKVKLACNVMDIVLLDHLIIVPQGKYLSFADESML